MGNCTVAIGRGLKEISEALRSEGYNVCELGKCGIGTEIDITVVDVPDYEYGEIEPVECYYTNNGKKMHVINSANFSISNLISLIKKKITA